MIVQGLYNLRKRNPRFAMPVKVIDVGADYVEYEFYPYQATKTRTAIMDMADFKERTTFSGIVDEPLSKFI